MLHVAVCDQEWSFVKELEQWIHIEESRLDISVECFCYRVGEELLWEIEEKGSFDLVLIGLTGQKEIKLAQDIIKESPYCLIIFLAEDVSMAYETFLVHPFSFLTKPVRQKDFGAIFREACHRINKQDEIFRFYSNRIYYQIPMSNILFFQSEKRKIRLIGQGGKEILFYNTLSKVEEYIQTLSVRFIRIHHSFLVNKNHIKRYCYDEIEMINGIILPISDEKKKSVKVKMTQSNRNVT